eukprot:PhM_4_TR5195/c0_g1_i1/m.46775
MSWNSEVIVYNKRGGELVVEPREAQHASTAASARGATAVVNAAAAEPTPWVPCEPQQHGLIEAYDRRGGAAAATYVPLASRPAEELESNFTNYKGKAVNLNASEYRQSRTQQTMSAFDTSIADDQSVHVHDVVRGMQSHLPSMTEERYYLVTYNDFSRYATSMYPMERRRDAWLKPAYVPRCFAVRVSPTQSGVFLPISNAQFVHGCEVVATEMLRGRKAAHETYLTRDEFATLRNYSGGSGNNNNNPRHNAAMGAAFGLEDGIIGHTAVTVRGTLFDAWQRWLSYRDQQYVAFGRFLVKSALMGVTAMVVYNHFYGDAGAATAATARRPRRGHYHPGSDPAAAAAATSSSSSLFGAARSLFLGV